MFSLFTLVCLVLGSASLAALCVLLKFRLGSLAVSPPLCQVKEPVSFDGSPSEFREWIFGIEQALSLCSLKDPVAFYLPRPTWWGSAKRWYMNLDEQGKKPQSWIEFRQLLESAFLPAHEREQSRIAMFRLKQTGSLQQYIAQFTATSLAVTDCDELTKTLLFVEGLQKELGERVRQKFPQSVQEAVRLAQVISDCMWHFCSP